MSWSFCSAGWSPGITLFSGRLLLNFEFAPTLTQGEVAEHVQFGIILAEPIPVLLLSIGVLRKEVLDRVPIEEREASGRPAQRAGSPDR